VHFELDVTPKDLPDLDRHGVERARRFALDAFAPRIRHARLQVAAREPGGVAASLSLWLANGLRLETRASAADAGAAVRRAMSRAQRALRRRLAGDADGTPRAARGRGGAA
jgi:hypothetical protein